MGTRFRVVLYAEDAAQAERAAQAAFERVRALEAVYSDYDPQSEARRLAVLAPVTAPASDDLVELTALALELGRVSGGAFDVTVGPLTRLWRRALRGGEAPDPPRLAAARAAVGADKLRVDRARGEVTLTASDMRLDFGGIAKGHAADEALAVLAAHGIERALVDGGGDVACGAAPPGSSGWRVGLAGLGGEANPQGGFVLLLEHAALATSGDLARGGEVDGRPRSHVIDPRSGQALDAGARLVSVLAPRGATADALASALLVLGGEAGVRLVAGIEGVEARLVEGSAVFTTAGFPRLVSSFLQGSSDLPASPTPPAQDNP